MQRSIRPSGLWDMLGAALFFSVMSLLVKEAGKNLPSTEIVLARGGFSLVAAFLQLRWLKIPLWGQRRGLLLLRGLLGFVGLNCFFYALTVLPLADTTVIHYTNPVFTALLAAWLLKERGARGESLCMLLCLVGVVLVVRPGFLFGELAADYPLSAALIALAGALFGGAAYVTVRKLGRTEHPLVVVFYFPLVAVPLTVPLLWGHAVWPSAWDFLLLLGIGLTTHAGQFLLTRGLQRERAGRATAIAYTQVVFAGTWGFLFFGELPTPLALGGMALIVGSTLLISRLRAGAPRSPGKDHREASERASQS